MIKVAEDNNLEIDQEALVEMVKAVYMDDDGAMNRNISRKQLRNGLE